MERGERRYTSTDFDFAGGLMGFRTGKVSYVTFETDGDNNGSYETLEHIEDFMLDSSGYADSQPTHDAAGNLTYDGVPRLHAHRDGLDPTAASLFQLLTWTSPADSSASRAPAPRRSTA